MRNFLCKIGLHWWVYKNDSDGIPRYRVCKNCYKVEEFCFYALRWVQLESPKEFLKIIKKK